MSTPKDLFHELKVLAKHYRAAAARKRSLVRELSGQLRGTWVCTSEIVLEDGKAYFTRSKFDNGGHSPASVQRFEHRGVRGVWVVLFGTDFSGWAQHLRYEVLVPAPTKPASSRRRPQGRKS